MITASAIRIFLLDCQAGHLSPNTVSRYQRDLTELENFASEQGVNEIEPITPDLLRDYFSYQLNRNNLRKPGHSLSPYSVHGRYRSIRRFFNFAVLERWIESSPMARVRKPKLPKVIPPRLSVDEVKRVLHGLSRTEMPERNLALLMLYAISGLRLTEALRLKLSDIDFETGVVIVWGKGDKQRVVPILLATQFVLQRWISRRPCSTSDRVFLSVKGTPLTESGVHTLFRRMKALLGMEGRFYPHLLRHTFANLYLQRTHDFKGLQQTLGHAQSSTTLDLYAHFDAAHLKRLHDEAMQVFELVDPLFISK